MATRSKGGNPTEKKPTKKSGKVSSSIHEHAPHLIDEAEKVAASVIGQVKQLFESLTHKISNGTPSTPASDDGATAVAPEQASEQHATGLLENVREAGEASVRAIGEGFESVRRRITERVASSPSPAGDGRKSKDKSKSESDKGGAAEKKKSKKKVAAKKASAKKTPAAKKSTSKKPGSTKVSGKKAASKKKTGTRKKAGGKKKSTRKSAKE